MGEGAEGLGASADCTSTDEVTGARHRGLGPACHSDTARRERKRDWAAERNRLLEGSGRHLESL